MDASSIAIVIIAEFALVFGLLWLFYVAQLKKAKRNIAQLRHKLRQYRNAAPGLKVQALKHNATQSGWLNYLREQLRISGHQLMTMGRDVGDFDPKAPRQTQLLALRAGFLEAERKAHESIDNRQEFWSEFDKLLHNILHAYQIEIEQATDDNEKSRLRQELASLKTQVQQMSGYEQDLNVAEEALDHLKLTLSQFQHNQFDVEELRTRLSDMHALRQADDAGLGSVSSPYAKVDVSLQVDYSAKSEAQMHAPLPERLESNETQRLMSICERQREIIEALRDSLNSRAPSAEDSLKLQSLEEILRETEACISAVDSDSRFMRDQFQAAQSYLPQYQPKPMDQNLRDELEKLQVQNHIQQQMNIFCEELFGAASIQDVAALMLETLRTFDLESIVLLKKATTSVVAGCENYDLDVERDALSRLRSNDRHLSIGSHHVVNLAETKIMIYQSASLDNEQLLFKLKCCESIAEVTQSYIRQMKMQGVDGLPDKRKYNELVDKADVQVKELYARYNDINSAEKNLLTNVSLVMSTMELRPEDNEVFKEIVDEYGTRFKANKSNMRRCIENHETLANAWRNL